MNWDAIGAIGEVVGATAVVLTLIYLAVQLRVNTKALQSSTFQSISEATARTFEVTGTTPDLAEITLKAQGGLDKLSEVEKIRFRSMLMASFRRIESVYIHESMGAILPKHSSGFKRSTLSILAHPGILEWWHDTKDAFTSEFVKWIDSGLKEHIAGIHVGLGKKDDSIESNT